MDRESLLTRARDRGVNPLVYWLVRAVLQPFFHIYFRMSRIGREHIPQDGPVIFAANHRSFLDPFVIATLARRPIYFVAKKELFANRLQAWILNSLGAFPIDRGAADEDSMTTARAILERGDGVLIFPEGTRVRPGSLGRPKRGVGRLALETGAPVVPVAVMGTETIRRGWRIRPHKVRIRAGRPLRFPNVTQPSAQLARRRHRADLALRRAAVGVARGLPPVRRAAVIGAGSWGTSVAVALARAGLEVDLGCRTAEQADELRLTALNSRYLPGVPLPDAVNVVRAADLELDHHDIVVLRGARPLAPCCRRVARRRDPRPAPESSCSPRASSRPTARCPRPTWPSGRSPARSPASAAPAHAADALANGASLVAGCADEAFGRQLTDVFTAAGFEIHHTTDVTGVELAGDREERRRLRGRDRLGGRAQRGRCRRRQGLLRGRRAGRAATAGWPRRSRGSPGRATSSPPWSPPTAATGGPASCSGRARPPPRSGRCSVRQPRRSTRCRCSPPRCAPTG